MNSVLFQPFRLHDLTLPNRIVLAPMTRGRAGAARLPNKLMAEYYAQRGSAGLLITEATAISEVSSARGTSCGCLPVGVWISGSLILMAEGATAGLPPWKLLWDIAGLL